MTDEFPPVEVPYELRVTWRALSDLGVNTAALPPHNCQEKTMNEIPCEPTNVSDDDFASSTTRVRATRAQVLANPRAFQAHRVLGEEIERHIDAKMFNATDAPHAD